jgi:hypothetical protein
MMQDAATGRASKVADQYVAQKKKKPIPDEIGFKAVRQRGVPAQDA